MPSKSIERKITGGKLVRMDIEFTSRIEQVKITGDFFLDPEETLEHITQACQNLPVPIDADALQDDLERIMQKMDAQFIGVRVADLVSMLEEAVS